MPLDNERDEAADALRLTAHVVAAFLSANPTPADAIPALIVAVHQALADLDAPPPPPAPERGKPAVAISRSIQPDYLVCLEDGHRLKMLKRYLRTRYGLTPEDYRRRWGLPPDYPMVAPNYAARRSEFARKIGLGRGVRAT